MSKANFWKADWFLGLLVSLAVLSVGGGDLLQSLERKAYDLGVAMASRQPSEKVAIIAIDKQSIDNIGRWPWSREIHAEMVEKLAAAKAKVIATTVFFSEPQIDPGLAYINRLVALYGQAGGVPLVSSDEALAAQPSLLGPMGSVLKEAEYKLNADRRLGEAYATAGNVALPMLFRIGEPRGRPDKALPDHVGKNAVKLVGGEWTPIPTSDVDAMVTDSLGAAVAAIGDRKSVV